MKNKCLRFFLSELFYKEMATSKSPFSKVAVRSTCRDVFMDQISRFMFPINIQRCNNHHASDRFIVCARVRPLLDEEISKKDIYDCITTTDQSVTVHAGHLRLNYLEMKHSTYCFDHIFGQNANNTDVYNIVRNVVALSIPIHNMKPIDTTVFLYGKTGTGKSHTINGIVQLFAQDIFRLTTKSHCQIRIGISAVEIVAGTKGFIVSNDNICDLYNNGMIVHFRDDEHGTMHLRGAKEFQCENSTQLDKYIKQAKTVRRTQATQRNSQSSRSHLIYFIRLRDENEQILSTITFVDLAGNEGQQDSLYFKAHSDQIKDSTSINRSLASLKDCIRAANAGSKVIPFRGSTLTRLLKKCFCSKETKTVFIGTVSGLPIDIEQSAQTLKYIGLIKYDEQEFLIEQITKLKTTTL